MCSCLIFVTPVDHDIGIRDCEAEFMETLLSPQLFHLDATNWDFKGFWFQSVQHKLQFLVLLL